MRYVSRHRTAKKMALVVLLAFSTTLVAGMGLPQGHQDQFFSYMLRCTGMNLRFLQALYHSEEAAQLLIHLRNASFMTVQHMEGDPEFNKRLTLLIPIISQDVRVQRVWDNCARKVCVPNTEHQEVNCRSLYFSFNPRIGKCIPQRGFCQRSHQHFTTWDQCETVCAETTGRAIGDVSKSQKQHGWLKIVLLASSSNDDGKMQEIFNKTFEFPSKNISLPSGYNIFPILYDMPSILYTTENKL